MSCPRCAMLDFFLDDTYDLLIALCYAKSNWTERHKT